MDRGFSVDDISGQFWSPPPAAVTPSPPSCRSEAGEPSPPSRRTMNRSESEWAFQRYLQEASVAPAASSAGGGGGGEEGDVVEVKGGARPDRDRAPDPIRNRPPDPNAASKNASEVGTGPPPAPSAPCADGIAPPFNGGAAPPPTNSEEYQAFLKSKLNLACAAVAMSRVRSLCLSVSLRLSLSMRGQECKCSCLYRHARALVFAISSISTKWWKVKVLIFIFFHGVIGAR